ncbi:MAG TPA: BTAD domain-containing putative transcriptional regulator, partial [Chloroflexota bacterium]
VGNFGGVATLWDHLFRYRPPTLSLIVLSRTVPALGFSALTALDAVVGLGHAELGFTPEEAYQLLNPLGVSEADARAYVERCGGWATGLVLLARTEGDGPAVLRGAEHMLAQIGPQLLQPLPPLLRRFLLESAVLGPISADDTRLILDREDSGALFGEALRQSFFLSFDGETYRYHDLFAIFLRDTLGVEDPEGLALIRVRAGRHWMDRGDVPRGLAFLAEAGAWPLLAEALTEHRRLLWDAGLWVTALRFVDLLPAHLQSTRLLTLAGFARIQRGEYAEAIKVAERGMREAVSDEDWLQPALLHIQGLHLAGRMDETVAGAEATMIRARRSGSAAAQTQALEIRGANLLRLGRHEEGQADLRSALLYYRVQGDTAGEARTAYNLAEGLIESGRVGDAAVQLDLAARLWHQQDNRVMAIYLTEVRAQLHLLEGDLVTAEANAREALRDSERAGHAIVTANCLAGLAEVLVDEGQAGEASDIADEALKRANSLQLPDVWNRAQRARLAAALARRERGKARLLLDEALPRSRTFIDQALLAFGQGQLSLRSRAYALAAQQLTAAAEDLARVQRPHIAARAWLLAADAYLARDVVGKAEHALDLACRCIQPQTSLYLRPTFRLARRVAERYRLLRHLRMPTRALLDLLAGAETDPTAVRVSPYGYGMVSVGGMEVDLLQVVGKRSREVFFYVALGGGRKRDEEVVEAVWPEQGEEAIRWLWEAGRHLRRLFGKDAWKVRAGACAFTRSIGSVEAEAAAHALACHRSPSPREVVEHATAGLGLIGDGRYLDWCENAWVEEARIRTVREGLTMALALAQAYDTLGQSELALAAARRAADFDPYDEQPQQAILRILRGLGRHEEALSVYRAFANLVSTELGLSPTQGLTLAAGLAAR